ncbi:unnamed protein product [Rhizoctonia solani]|uniref:Uncharacterized protein n=1 Tax=Rhizoctonia solani TaxID=456999 RepID=A0A8H3AS54_9AGAM|nr:unnamed protein product [Rhizoctonia solani]
MPGGAVLVPSDGRKRTFREKLPPKHVVYPFALVTSLFFLWGFAYGLLDVLNKHFQNILHISKLESTGLQVAYFGLGYFCFSPIAGEILRRKSYKFTILMGLSLYSTGAVFFWPCAKFASEDNKKAVFAGFVVCTGVIACGLASLETAANSYITCLPGTDPSGAAFRLQLSQAFNGVAAFSGPLIASKYFFSGENANNLTNVQWVYLAVALLGVSIALLFAFIDLPETSEAELEAAVQAAAEIAGVTSKTDDSIFKQHRVWFGWVAQFVYVGAQVTIASFFINYGADAVGHGSHLNVRHEKVNMAQVEPALEATGHKSLNLHSHEKSGFDGNSISHIRDVREDELKDKV